MALKLTDILKRRRKIERDMQIFRRYCEGYMVGEICERFGMNRSQIYKVLRELRDGGLQFKTLEKTPWD
ncbi:helix-turn-helix domain-containing protein [Candidatus Pacearchaeota archaeon]|jgi:transposase-like protein|nr:helix-turn-helix domain-containing protein [Candidatus Pacearchaeota archaeon]